MNIPQIMSHRGDLRSDQENTLEAFQTALAAGILHLECDVQINASGTPVLFHDPDLLRIWKLKQSVFDLEDGQQPRLPPLSEVLDLADRYPGATLYLEIKHHSLQHWGEEVALQKLAPWEERVRRHVLFARSTSFLERARRAGYPRVGVILRKLSPATLEQMATFEPDFLVINVTRIPQDEPLWPGPWKWAVYEVGDFHSVLAWGSRGADFVLSHNGRELFEQMAGIGR